MSSIYMPFGNQFIFLFTGREILSRGVQIFAWHCILSTEIWDIVLLFSFSLCCHFHVGQAHPSTNTSLPPLTFETEANIKSLCRIRGTCDIFGQTWVNFKCPHLYLYGYIKTLPYQSSLKMQFFQAAVKQW